MSIPGTRPPRCAPCDDRPPATAIPGPHAPAPDNRPRAPLWQRLAVGASILATIGYAAPSTLIVVAAIVAAIVAFVAALAAVALGCALLAALLSWLFTGRAA